MLGEDLVEVLKYSYTSGRLSLSQRSELITLRYKRGDHLEMKNWRPITLLRADYKIAAKAIANRLLEVLPTVVYPDQSCGVRGRDPDRDSRPLPLPYVVIHTLMVSLYLVVGVLSCVNTSQ